MRHPERTYLLAALLSVASFVGCEPASETAATTPETTPLAVEAESPMAEPAEAAPRIGSRHILVSGSQAYRAYQGIENGFPVTIGIDDGQVVFKASNAKGFELPGGEIVGVTRLKDLSDEQRQNLVHERGYAYTCDSTEGWTLAWGFEKPPSSDDPILWAFKRTPSPLVDEHPPESGGWSIELDGE